MSSSSQALLPWLSFLAIPSIIAIKHAIRRNNDKVKQDRSSELKYYSGSCHCKGVTFRVAAQRSLTVWRCNCSICFMKKNWHFIVPAKSFNLKSGSELLTEYKFNTKTATHVFCKVCGVQAYYIPRSNPDGVAVTLACIPPEQVEEFEITDYDGQNWESFYATSNIKDESKVDTYCRSVKALSFSLDISNTVDFKQ